MQQNNKNLNVWCHRETADYTVVKSFIKAITNIETFQ